MRPEMEPLHDLLDRWMRETLLHPANLRAFLREAVPDLAEAFDCERAKLLDREFPMDDWRRREADVPFEIPYHVGDETRTALVFLLIEHQSDTDTLVPLRTLYFAVLYWDRQWQAWTRLPKPRPPLRLNPVLPLVLYTNDIPWGSNRTLRDLLGEPAAFHAFAPAWQPLFWNLSERTTGALLDSGEEWLQTLAVIRAQAEDAAGFQTVFAEAMRRIESLHGRDHARWYNLMRIMVAWVEQRRPSAEHAPLLAAAQANIANVNQRQEVTMMANTMAEVHFEQGMRRGDLRTARDLLRTLLENRFGAVPEVLTQQIDSMEDLEKLKKAFKQALRLEKLEDFQL